jgi:hypothetical protein
MLPIDRLAEDRPVPLGAQHRDSEVSEGRTGALDRVVERGTTFDPAVEDAVSHAGPSQLHREVRRSRETSPDH